MLLVFFAVVLLILIVSTIILSIMNTNREQTVSHTTLSNQFSSLSNNPTTLYYSWGTISGAILSPDSVDVAGSVIGTLTGSGTFEVIVRFSTPFASAPKAVMLTPGTPSSGTPTIGYLLTVDNIKENQFEVIGYSPTAVSLSTLFYYSVV